MKPSQDHPTPVKATPNAAQQQAIDHIYGPLLVIAGPGTGKTQLLSARVANILGKTDTNPENILCLTFTESGAANMRARLATLLKRASAKVHIHTYHSFGRTILDAYQHYSDQPIRFYDRPIDAVTTYEILSHIEDSLPTSDILKSAKISDLADTIRELKSARLTPEDVARVATHNLEANAGLNSAISTLLKSLIPRKYEPNVAVYTSILEQLTRHISKTPIAKNIEPEANFLARSLSQILDDQAAAEKPSISPLTKWKDAHFEKDSAGNYRSKNLISNYKLLSISHIYELYQAELTANDLFDYADMIEQAIAYLSSDDGFRMSLEERYQFILLDEFQDTNPSQFDLVKSLTASDQPNIMAVGDDDQAIMEFQGAQASNLLDFESHYSARVITLTENYRSTQAILDFSKKIADQIADSFSRTHGIEKRLIAKNPSPETSISRHTFSAAPSEYAWIAAEIRSLIDSGTDPSDIAIITAKHKYIPTLLPHLTGLDIPIAYEKREDILQDPRIASLTTLAEFIHALASGRQAAHLLLPLLSAPHWSISPLSALTALEDARASKRSALTFLEDSPDPKLSAAAHFFAALAVRSLDTPLELLIDYMIGIAPLDDFRSPFLEHYAEDPSLYENLFVLRETVANYSRKSTLRLADLISAISAYRSANQPITNTSPYQTSTSSVQILSAHKAKGLEFAHVFLVALDDRSWGNAGGNNNTLTLPKNLEAIRHTGITEDERLRLFFVAITRAKSHLYLTSSREDFSGKSSPALEYLDEQDSLSPLLPEGSREIIARSDSAPPLAPLKHHWQSAYATYLPDVSAVLRRRLENYRLTPTDLTTFIDIIYSGPTALYLQKLGAPLPPPDHRQLYGNFIHSALDFATKHKSASPADILAHYTAELDSADLSAESKSALLEQGTTDLPIIIAKLYKVLSSPTSVSEVNFRSENLTIGDVPITGKIDLLEIDEAAKTITIYDYKTTPYDPKKSWKTNATLFRYRLQLGFYKLLLEHSPKYSRYKVQGAQILHLTPTPHGELIPRPYDFPSADESQLRSLIKTVYHHITSLDFPPIPPDADRKLSDILDFISTL